MSAGDTRTDAALVVQGHPQWTEEPSGPEATLLSIDRQGAVTAFAGKVEYGQHIRSGFTAAIAEELDAPYDAISIILGDTSQVPSDRGTTGSASTRTVGLQLRRAAATARQTLVDLAAARLGHPAEQLAVRSGQVYEADDSTRTVTFAELLHEQNIRVSIDDDVSTKSPEGALVTGSLPASVDVIDSVTGRARYAHDITLPGMLHGKVLRPPSYGARLRRVDGTRAERVPGFVALVQEDDFVGVVAEREGAAELAIEALRASWDEDRPAESDWDLPTLLKESAGEPVVLRREGSVAEGLDQADHVLEGSYFLPYVFNAAMETSAAVASWDDDRLTVWCGDRSPFGVRDQLAEATDTTVDNVRVVTPRAGGSFGSKGTALAAVESARLAKAAGRPVRVTYSRSEEFAWSTVRPAGVIEIRSGFSSDGTIVAWEYVASHAGGGPFRGQRGADSPYDVENTHISVAQASSPLRSGSYRSLGGAVNHFAREVHMDEIAATLGLDPVELRLRNLTEPRFRRVLTAAADRFGWSSRRAKSSTGYGMALGFDVGSYAAECVELVVEGQEVAVRRVVAAFDCGLVVDPDGVRNQVEGSIVMGMGTALWEAVEFDGGRLLNASFGGYRVPRITDTPDIEVTLVGDPTDPSTGAGEPAIVPIAAAIDNAVYDATGARIRELPIAPRLT